MIPTTISECHSETTVKRRNHISNTSNSNGSLHEDEEYHHHYEQEQTEDDLMERGQQQPQTQQQTEQQTQGGKRRRNSFYSYSSTRQQQQQQLQRNETTTTTTVSPDSQSPLFLSVMADHLSSTTNTNTESAIVSSQSQQQSSSNENETNNNNVTFQKGFRRQSSSFTSASQLQQYQLSSSAPNSSLSGGEQPAFKLFAILIVLVGLVASGCILTVGIRGANNDMQETFDNDSRELVLSINNAWQDYETYGLWIHESCHLTHAHSEVPITQNVPLHVGFCTRAKFQRLYEYIKNLGLDFVAMQYCPNVTHAQRSALEQSSFDYYEENYPQVAEFYQGIKEVIVTNGITSSIRVSPPKPYYFPIHYVLPLENNERIADIDLVPFDGFRIEKVFRTGKPHVSERVQVWQDTGTSLWAVTLMHPGIRTSIDEQLEQKGHTPNKAVAKVIIRVSDLLQRVSNYAGMVRGMSIYLYDVSEENLLQSPQGTSAIFLAGADVVGTDQLKLREEIPLEDIPRTRQDLFYSERITVADKEWLVVTTPYDDDIYRADMTYIILGAAIIFTACVMLAIWFHCHLKRVSRMNQMKHESQVERAQAAVNQVKRERHLNDFIAHEVRNPLSSAIVALSFVSETTHEHVHSEQTRRALLEDIGIMECSLNYINDLLRNMLDIHRTKNKEIMLKCESTNLRRDILEPCNAILCVRGAKAKMVEVHVESSPHDLYAQIDRLRVEQILLNLAMNSTKFVESGFIRLGCATVPVNTEKGEEEHVILYVEDSGPGIPQDKRERLFEKYQESLDLLNQGTGIGLYICKHLSDIMGATISLDESYDSGIPGQPGTRFVIDLKKPPLPVPDDEDSEHVALLATPLSDGLSTAGSDNQTSAETAPTSSENSVNSSTEHIVKSAAAAFSSNRLDVASETSSDLLSQHPPGNSLVNMPRPSPFLQVVDEVPSSLSSAKPKQSEAGGTVPSPYHQQMPHKSVLPEDLNVLFVDDDATLRKLFARSLKRVAPNWQVDQAPNGETAIEIAMEADKEKYDIIFMDQYMASTEKQLLGTDTIRILRANGVNCLICGLSANDQEGKFRIAGADDFILKPFPCERASLQKELLRVLNARGPLLPRHEVDDDSNTNFESKTYNNGDPAQVAHTKNSFPATSTSRSAKS